MSAITINVSYTSAFQECYLGKLQEDLCQQLLLVHLLSRIRRYQMGCIKLAFLVTHAWYLKRVPSYIANNRGEITISFMSAITINASYASAFFKIFG